MGYADLVALRPKRLSDSLYALIKNDLAVLDFGTAKVILKGDNGTNMPPCIMSIARLFTAAYDTATSLNGAEIPDLDVDKILWNEIPINITDVSIFNAISSAGEDLFWQGTLRLDNGVLKIDSQGLVYYIHYEMSKMATFTRIIPADFHIFWYLYQMFKDVSKKNLGILKIGTDTHSSNIYLTDGNDSFYIVINPNYKEFTEKAKSFQTIIEAYKALEYGKTSEFSKKAMTLSPLQKHLLKPFDELVTVSESDISTRFCNSFSCVHINKQKGK